MNMVDCRYRLYVLNNILAYGYILNKLFNCNYLFFNSHNENINLWFLIESYGTKKSK